MGWSSKLNILVGEGRVGPELSFAEHLLMFIFDTFCCVPEYHFIFNFFSLSLSHPMLQVTMEKRAWLPYHSTPDQTSVQPLHLNTSPPAYPTMHAHGSSVSWNNWSTRLLSSRRKPDWYRKGLTQEWCPNPSLCGTKLKKRMSCWIMSYTKTFKMAIWDYEKVLRLEITLV